VLLFTDGAEDRELLLLLLLLRDTEDEELRVALLLDGDALLLRVVRVVGVLFTVPALLPDDELPLLFPAEAREEERPELLLAPEFDELRVVELFSDELLPELRTPAPSRVEALRVDEEAALRPLTADERELELRPLILLAALARPP